MFIFINYILNKIIYSANEYLIRQNHPGKAEIAISREIPRPHIGQYTAAGYKATIWIFYSFVRRLYVLYQRFNNSDFF